MTEVTFDKRQFSPLANWLQNTDMDSDAPLFSRKVEEGECSSEVVPVAATVPARAAVALGALYLLLLLLAPHVRAPAALWVGVVSLVVFIYFPLAIVYHGVCVPLGPAGELLGGIIALGIWLAMVGLEGIANASLVGPAQSVSLLVTAMFFGMIASRVMRDRNILLPACIVAAFVDLLSVKWGLTGHALEQAPTLVTKLSVAIPQLAATPRMAGGVRGFPIVATIGLGDIFFIALFFGAAARFGLPLRRTFCWVFPLVVVAMALTLMEVLPWRGIPGLPFVSFGFLAANFRQFRLSAEERRALGVASLLLIVVLLTLFAFRNWPL
ncbi:MAG: hypothetical protein ACUVX8_13135 [Candidatus Zipacnadales bacterium]